MARCRMKGLDGLLESLDSLAGTDEISEEMLTEGADILKGNLKAAITKAANRGYATGELASSVIPTAPGKNRYGHYVAVRPVGTDSKGVRNGEKWGYLENGTGKGQEPHPFEDEAVKKTEPECQKRMQEVFDRHVK